MKNVRREDWESLEPTVYGWGINDVNYRISINSTVGYTDGKRIRKMLWICPYYEDWSKMIQRCYDPKYLNKHPTYIGCTVCEDWKYFSNFIKWVDSQPNRDWKNCQLDKDLLSGLCKSYSPETCIYLSKDLNQFLTEYNDSKGKLIGAYSNKSSKNNYYSQCYDPTIGKIVYLGEYQTETEAHLAWKSKKYSIAIILSSLQQDKRVAEALINYYS